MKTILIILLIIAAALAALLVAAGFAALGLSVSARGVRRADARAVRRGKTPTPYRTHSGEAAEWWYSQRLERFEITAFDGIKLVGNALRAEKPTAKTALVLHGHDCDAGSIGFISRMFYESGYNVFAPEMRAGKSGGRCYSFGVFESRDALLWLKKLPEIFGADCRVVMYGNSLGGGTVCMVSGMPELPKQLRCIVSDCAYSDLRSVLELNLAMLPKPLSASVLFAANILCRIVYGFYFDDARPIDAVRRAGVPMFFVHGEDDTTTLPEMSRRMYELAPVEKELLIVPNCRHAVAYFADTELFTRRILAFCDRFLG